MTDSKMPSEPTEEERWVKVESEVHALRRRNSILSVGLILQGIAVIANSLSIRQINDTLTILVSFNELVYEHLNCLSDSFLRILNDFEVLLGTLSKIF